MKFLDRFRSAPKTNTATRQVRRPAIVMPVNFSRNFKGADQGRLTLDWISSNLTSDAELQRHLKSLRFRSRDLERNDDYMRSFLKNVETQVVGPDGVNLQMQVREPNGSVDQAANTTIETAWKKWTRRGICTMDGRLSWADVERLFIRSVARDGEVLVRMVEGRQAGNEFGFAVQLVEADHLDEDDLRVLPDNKKIKMGVECNEWNRPLAYHLWTEHPGEVLMARHRFDKVRVPADNLVHGFIQERAGQSRGLPWIVSAMLRLKMLGGYEEAELVAARLASSKMGFFTSEDGESYQGDGEDSDGSLITDAEPGTFEQLPTGVKFESWSPEHPTNAFAAFHKAMVRGAAASVGMTYPSFSGDLEGVNFSSIRQGSLNERDGWRVIQNWEIGTLHQAVFPRFLAMGITTGAIRLPMTKFEKFNKPKWQPRGWDWVDPQKEANANLVAFNGGMKSRTAILAARGISYEDFLDELKAEQDLADAKGVRLPEAGAVTLSTLGVDNGQSDDDEDED
jgi:lambda family phage portal protein